MSFFMRTYNYLHPNALLKQVFQHWTMPFYECMYVERQLHNKHVLETHLCWRALQVKIIDFISHHLLYSCYNLNPVKRKYFQFWHIIPLCNWFFKTFPTNIFVKATEHDETSDMLKRKHTTSKKRYRCSFMNGNWRKCEKPKLTVSHLTCYKKNIIE